MLSDCFVPFPLALATNCSCTVLLYTGYLPFSSCIYILPKIHQTYAAPFRFIVLSILTMQIIISFVFIISTYRYKVNINRIEFIKI